MSKKSKTQTTTIENVGTSWISTETGSRREDGLGHVEKTPKGKYLGFIGTDSLKNEGSIRYFSSLTSASGAVDDEIALNASKPAEVPPAPAPKPTLSEGASDAVATFLAERDEPKASAPKTRVPARTPKPKKAAVIPDGYTEEQWNTMSAGQKAAATRRFRGGLPAAKPVKPAPEGYESTWASLSAGQKAAITRRLNGNLPANSKPARKSEAPLGFDGDWASLTAGRKAAITRQYHQLQAAA